MASHTGGVREEGMLSRQRQFVHQLRVLAKVNMSSSSMRAAPKVTVLIFGVSNKFHRGCSRGGVVVYGLEFEAGGRDRIHPEKARKSG